MLKLENNDLRIDLLDPRDPADKTRLGWRFAHGGLIWQVTDKKAGALLTGPQWPEPKPSPFNAQGLVESFRHRTRDGKLYTWRGNEGVAIGSGRVALDEAKQVVMTAMCSWHIVSKNNTNGTSLIFSTSDAFAGFDYALTREVVLERRTVRVISCLTNRSAAPLVLEWFPHPFFAYTEGLIRAHLPKQLRMVDNAGFTFVNGELSLKRRFIGTDDGHMEVIPWVRGVPCVFSVDHPKLIRIDNELIGLEPFECVVWGNGNTFSIEPYAHLEIAPGATNEFEMRHVFGALQCLL